MDLLYYACGIFRTNTRDRSGCAYRLLMEQCSAKAVACYVPLADPDSGFGFGAAMAAASMFVSSAPDPRTHLLRRAARASRRPRHLDCPNGALRRSAHATCTR